jgi:prevent-host-death family protein
MALREHTADTIGRVRHGGERVVITKNSKQVAAMISLDDLALLERLEDKLDILLADEAEATARAKREKPVKLADVKARLGL